MMSQEKKTRVLIIDDSRLIRTMLRKILSADGTIEVIGEAEDPYEARRKIKTLNPDVLTLDVEMPKMDGVSFLKNIMRLRPMPVVMISSLTKKGAETTLRALQLGAIDFVSKPGAGSDHELLQCAEEICEKVKVAAVARVSVLQATEGGNSVLALTPAVTSQYQQIVALGASAGGTEALRKIISRMPANAPGIVIALHIPALFSKSFAKRMDDQSQLSVAEAENGQLIRPGRAYVAPGGRHLEIQAHRGGYRCKLSDGPPVLRHRPSVDVMFRSVAKCAGDKAVAAILTGMGKDGSEAIGCIKAAGGTTIAQNEETSLVWGMPGVAVSLGSVDEVLPLNEIAEHIVKCVSGPVCKRKVAR